MQVRVKDGLKTTRIESSILLVQQHLSQQMCRKACGDTRRVDSISGETSLTSIGRSKICIRWQRGAYCGTEGKGGSRERAEWGRSGSEESKTYSEKLCRILIPPPGKPALHQAKQVAEISVGPWGRLDKVPLY